MDPTSDTLPSRIAELESALSVERGRVAELEKEHAALRAAYDRLRLELELLHRRLFLAKAERIDTNQLELEFAAKLRALDEMAGTLDVATSQTTSSASQEDPASPTRKRRKPTGRRNLRELPLAEERVELKDPFLEKLVEEGKAERCGFEESCKLAWKRGGMRRLVIARAKYSTVASDGESAVETTPVPKEVLWRCVASASLLAHLITDKHCDGMPLFRQEQRCAREGVSLDRGLMSRWLEDIGATFGATIVEAMRKDALANAFCIATDATGLAIQPEPREDKRRQACRKGHFFVQVADRDAVFFEYTPRETSQAVGEMFRGFTGYVQADAKSVYDILFRQAQPNDDDFVEGTRKEVACLSHGRRGFWEAAIGKHALGREGLVRLHRIFELDASWAGRPHEDIRRLRDAHLRPHLEAFFAWAEHEHEAVKAQRGILRRAFGYVVRHKDALLRVLEDGRLVLTNNRSEMHLRVIAVGRKAWLFCGSDDHAQAAGHLFTLIASARLHSLDPEAYLRDILRVLPYWPKDRYLELSPKHWSTTRARLTADELAREVGDITVPPPAPTEATEEQPAAG